MVNPTHSHHAHFDSPADQTEYDALNMMRLCCEFARWTLETPNLHAPADDTVQTYREAAVNVVVRDRKRARTSPTLAVEKRRRLGFRSPPVPRRILTRKPRILPAPSRVILGLERFESKEGDQTQACEQETSARRRKRAEDPSVSALKRRKFDEGEKQTTEREFLDVIESQWIVGNCIGQGSFGSVFEAVHRNSKRRAALKIVRNDPNAAQEVEVLRRLKHENVIEMIDWLTCGTHTAIFLELGSPVTLDDSCVTQRLHEALQAVAYLHRSGVSHRDVKPDNFLLVNGSLKVIDFGLADLGAPQRCVKGTMGFLAPELANLHPCQNLDKVDEYAVACSFFPFVANMQDGFEKMLLLDLLSSL